MTPCKIDKQQLCIYPDCKLPMFKTKYCKKHFILRMKQYIRRQLSVIYRDPVSAYGVFDFFGKGKIEMKDILKNRTILKITEGLYT